jgi:hypothetical protein
LHSENCTNQVSEVKEDETGSAHGVTKIVYRIFIREPDGKGKPEKPRHTYRWQDYTQLDLREMGWVL